MLHGAFARMEATRSCRKPWTMLVELVLTVILSTKTGLVSSPTPLGPTVTTPWTATSKGRVKGPVTLREQPLLLHLTPVNPSISLFFFFFSLLAFIPWNNNRSWPFYLFLFFWWAGSGGTCVYPSSVRYVFVFDPPIIKLSSGLIC